MVGGFTRLFRQARSVLQMEPPAIQRQVRLETEKRISFGLMMLRDRRQHVCYHYRNRLQMPMGIDWSARNR